MGTNYYVYEKSPCKHCGRPFEQLHIGKSSWGWCFSLHVYPEDSIYDLDDWKTYWKGKTIVNEYEEVISEEEMLKIITERSHETDWKRPPLMITR